MDSLQDMLSNNPLEEPPQVRALKEYVTKQYESASTVTVTPRNYILAVASAPLASNLQLERAQIELICKLDKPLRIRIGS